jgi:hypothetical protein
VKARHWSVLLAVVSAAFVLAAANGRDSWRTVWGDESTYLAMTRSLALDGDLWFTAEDRARLTDPASQDAWSRARQTVILQRTAGGIAYSKPVLYALLAAPAYRVAGDFGPILLNLLLLVVAGWLGWLFLRRLGERGHAALTLVTFIGASVLLAHVGWRMSDLLQAALSLAALVLTLTCLRPAPDDAAGWLDGRGAAWLGGALGGLLIAARWPNVIVVAAVLAALVAGGRERRAAEVVGGALLALAVMAGVSQLAIGTASPYRAVRSSFDAASGYPVTITDEAGERFDGMDLKTQRLGLLPEVRPRLSAYATLYFWLGRHSGLLWYFPALVALLAAALRRPDRMAAILLLGAAASAAFYLVWWPQNYFGGSTFLGNRYFLPIYPLLLVALPRLPGRLALTAAWLLAAVAGGSALLSIAQARPAAFSQSHAQAGLFARAPYESTATEIDGRQDRYWAGDLLRFVNPEPHIGADSLVLESGAAPVEILLVTSEVDSPILLRYRTATPGLELVVEQGGETRRYALGARPARTGSLRVPLARAWRRHPFWWDETRDYAARTVRLAVAANAAAAAAPEGAKVRLWYGGDPAFLERSFEARVGAVKLPRRATAGSLSKLDIEVRNMSPVPWAAAGAFPVRLSYRLLALDGGGGSYDGERVDLVADVPSGDPVEMELAVSWPRLPGRYRLRVDLLIEDYAWFADRRGEPLAEGVVEVVAAADE